MGLINMHKTLMEPVKSSAQVDISLEEIAKLDENTHHLLHDEQGELLAVPKLNKVETFEQKLYRKFTEEPLVPIGCVVTTYFLGSGIKSFFDRDMRKSQKMMRARVSAQFGTILVFIGYAGWNSFNLALRPQAKETQEE